MLCEPSLVQYFLKRGGFSCKGGKKRKALWFVAVVLATAHLTMPIQRLLCVMLSLVLLGSAPQCVPSGHHGAAVSDPQVKSDDQAIGFFRSPLTLRMTSLFDVFFRFAGFRTCGCGQRAFRSPFGNLRCRLRIRRSAREGNRTRSTG